MPNYLLRAERNIQVCAVANNVIPRIWTNLLRPWSPSSSAFKREDEEIHGSCFRQSFLVVLFVLLCSSYDSIPITLTNHCGSVRRSSKLRNLQSAWKWVNWFCPESVTKMEQICFAPRTTGTPKEPLFIYFLCFFLLIGWKKTTEFLFAPSEAESNGCGKGRLFVA